MLKMPDSDSLRSVPDYSCRSCCCKDA
jgi:hypothetical protein